MLYITGSSTNMKVQTAVCEFHIYIFFVFSPKNIQPVLSILSLPVRLDHHSLLSLKHQFLLKHHYT